MTEPRKPTPDELLARVQREEGQPRQPGRGRLKIFLGYAAGVGKTYMMLAEAHRRKGREGQGVVIGFVETHGRQATKEQIGDLEVIPRVRIEYRGSLFEEMDLNAVLRRKPEWALVDEIAHTNIPGCRHEKRWQDVEEILNHGINVLTTVNVQHLESLNDTVFRLTGVRVRETLPDRIVHEADEVVDVDVSVRALLNRMKRGEVYPAEKAEVALENFFREDKLIALREICFQEAAQRTDEDLAKVRPLYETVQRPTVQEKVMICMPAAPMATHILRHGSRLAQRLHAHTQVVAVCVQPARTTPQQQQDFTKACEIAHRLDIPIVTLTNSDVGAALTDYALQNGVTQIVLGHKPLTPWSVLIHRSVLSHLMHSLRDVDIMVVGEASSHTESQM